jgi:rfaE bifunctional protein kinase chain/domain
MSAEAPIVVVREIEAKEYIGGAAIVAGHIKTLGADVHLLSVVGKDNASKMLKKSLSKEGINFHLIEDKTRPTTYKVRYMVENQKMFRVSRLKEHDVPSSIETQIIAKLNELAPIVKGIFISDFSYGVITQNIVNAICKAAQNYNIKLFGDSQSSSQLGNLLRLKNCNVLFPTEREARLALGNKSDGIETTAIRLMKETNAKNLIIKLGSEGFIVYESKSETLVNREHFPAMCLNPVDVAGAGDAMMAAIGSCYSAGSSLMDSATIGSLVASLAVQKLGNVPVRKKSIEELIEKTWNLNNGK